MFDLESADRVRRFARLCQPSQGRDALKPVELLPWQWDQVVKPFYGTLNADGTRQYRKLSLWVPRRNGKSFLCSILALYHLLADHEQGAHVVIVANSISQARVIFDEAAKFVEQSTILSSLVWSRPNIKTLQMLKGYGVLEVLSADKNAKLGRNISACLIDEIAEGAPHSRAVYDAMIYSMSNRTQPALITISSAGIAQDSLGRELYEVARDVKNGVKQDPQLLPVIFEAGQDCQWDDIETAKKANPSFGLTITEQDFNQCIAEARNNNRLVNKYRCFKLNQWVSNLEAWLQPYIIDQCHTPFDEEMLYGKEAFCGVDIARGLHDLSAYSIIIPHEDYLYVVSRAFTPQDSALMKEEKEHIPYTQYASEGHCFLTPGDTIDLKIIKQKLLEDCDRFQMVEIGYDPNLAGTAMEELRDEFGINTTAVIQSYPSLSDAVLTTEKWLYEKKFKFNSPLLRSHFINAATKEDYQNRVILDKQNTKGRIDCAQATVIAVHRYLNRATWAELWLN